MTKRWTLASSGTQLSPPKGGRGQERAQAAQSSRSGASVRYPRASGPPACVPPARPPARRRRLWHRPDWRPRVWGLARASDSQGASVTQPVTPRDRAAGAPLHAERTLLTEVQVSTLKTAPLAV